jgi:hypothetical protein
MLRFSEQAFMKVVTNELSSCIVTISSGTIYIALATAS